MQTLTLTEQEKKAVILALRTLIDTYADAEPDKWHRAALRVLKKIGVGP